MMSRPDGEVHREEMEQALSEARSHAGVQPAGFLKGCCYLTTTRGTRECFDGFSESECASAARQCGCSHLFVPGGRCS
jgi:hypothetical protein